MPCIRAPGTGGPTSETSFSNWAGDVQVNPAGIYQPTSIDQLVAIVKAAEQANELVHAVGSGWSFNDNFSTSGILIRTDSLNRILSNTMGAVSAQSPSDPSGSDPVFLALTGKSKERKLIHVEAGIKVHDLHDILESLSIVNGVTQADGFALPTLGGSGGQSLSGAISTSTHGGDVRIPPLPDMVHGVHLVAPGGVEFFIQRGGMDAIVDTRLLAETMPCVAGRIISDNEIFNAVLVSMGRMGVIYSMVIEVVDQFILEETRFKSDWATVSSSVNLGASGDPGTITDLWFQNRFLQIVVLPYASSGNRDCYVSIRNCRPPGTPLKPDPNKNDPFSLACRLLPLEKSAVVLLIIAAAAAAALAANGLAAAADAAAAALSWIPFVGEAAIAVAAILDAAAVAADVAAAAVAVALAPLLVPSITIGDYIATVTNLLTEFDLIDVATDTVNALLSSELGAHDVIDLSFRVMDTYDYEANCYKARSLEVAFNADEATYLTYVDKLFELIENFKSQNILYGGYISLRYCGSSEALLAIERWERTVCLEMSALSGLDSEMQVLSAFEAAAADLGATIHWGQLNNRSRPDIEAVFANTITVWRQALRRTSAEGTLTTFDNDFCSQRGLEVYDVKARGGSDISYIVPLVEN